MKFLFNNLTVQGSLSIRNINISPVPGPVVGAGIPGLILAGGPWPQLTP